MRKGKKVMALLLSVAIFASLGVGCSSKNGKSSDKEVSQNQNASATNYSNVQKPDNIHW